MTKVYQFKHCTAYRNLENHYLETVFEDGTKVSAYPQFDSEDQRASARRLGYGEDIAALCHEHELLHTWLAERFDLDYSPTLWAVAHEQGEGCIPIWAQYKEEALVMAFQGYLNGRSAEPVLDCLAERGLSLEDLREEAIRLFRGEPVEQVA